MVIVAIVKRVLAKSENAKKRTTKKIKKSALFLIVVLVVWGGVGFMQNTTGIGGGGALTGDLVPGISGGGYGGGSGYNNYQERSNNNGSNLNYDQLASETLQDDREFLKTGYGANVTTRKVGEVVDDVTRLVRSIDGRVNSYSSNEKRGNVQFLIPKDELDSFRDELEDLDYIVDLKENITSKNLLKDKQSLERRQEEAVDSIVDSTQRKAALEAQYKIDIANIEEQISQVDKEVAGYQAILTQTDLPEVTKVADTEIQNLLAKRSSLSAKRSSITNTYNRASDAAGSDISEGGSDLIQANQDEDNFLDYVETVQGTVNVSWVSTWSIVQSRLPIDPIVLIALVFVAISLLRHWFGPQRDEDDE